MLSHFEMVSRDTELRSFGSLISPLPQVRSFSTDHSLVVLFVQNLDPMGFWHSFEELSDAKYTLVLSLVSCVLCVWLSQLL